MHFSLVQSGPDGADGVDAGVGDADGSAESEAEGVLLDAEFGEGVVTVDAEGTAPLGDAPEPVFGADGLETEPQPASSNAATAPAATWRSFDR